MNKKIVITGMGPLSSTGIGIDALWKGILAKKTGLAKKNVYVDEKLWDSYWYHKIRRFNINDFDLDKRILKDITHWQNGYIDRDMLYLFAAISLALHDAHLSYNKDSNNIGLIVTIEHPGFEPLCEKILRDIFTHLKKSDRRQKKPSLYNIAEGVYSSLQSRVYNSQTFMYLFLAAKMFNFHGYSLFTNNACASGLFALETAAQQIRSGKCNAVIVAGGDYPATLFKHRWFKERDLYAQDGKIKPFSSSGKGLVFGDGASALVLEDFQYAKQRKANIYAEYRGGGFSLEGWKVTLPKIGGQSYQNAISNALKAARLKPCDIDIINPHGVGIKMTDYYETRAITDIFGKDINQQPFVSAFKPYVGHNLGGSALLETIILLLSLKHNTIPPILNHNKKDNTFGLNLVTSRISKSLNVGMKLACGFAGYNSAAIFSKRGL